MTLDHLLCDPKLAGEFDQYVLSMLPDRPDSLKIRWLGLRLRKNANYIARTAAALESKVRMPRGMENPFELEAARVPAAAGLYWVMAGKKRLYVGETENLRERLGVQFHETVRFDFWGNARQELAVAFRAESHSAGMLAKQQSRWIAEWRPIGNYSRLGMRQAAAVA